ncbi:MAG: protein translocase subunit SecD [Planctomycetota bacterium]
MDSFSIVDFVMTPLFLAQASLESGEGNPSDENWSAYFLSIGFVLGIFVLPFVVSHFITKAIRMPDHAVKLGVMIAAIVGGLLFAWKNDFALPLGPDMKGGTTLVYNIVEAKDGNSIDASALATALSDRINPSGTKEYTIRPRGTSQIEITVPATDELELNRIQSVIEDAGQLEFRIVANTRDHPDVIQLAREQASNKADRFVVNAAGDKVGEWFRVQRDATQVEGVSPLKTPVLGDIIRNSLTGEIIDNPRVNPDESYSLEKWMDRVGIRNVDVLMSYGVAGSPYAYVTGDDLASAQTSFGSTGYKVEFRLDQVGSDKMLRLTAANQPDGAFKRRMAIIMDKEVLSAPNLNSAISTQGVIEGNFKKEEVEFLVTILRAGRLPATLETPAASQTRVGAGLGATTVEKGTNASIWAVITTFACILVYYRFSGAVASLALIINGILIFGIMIFISQPLTLPGLAGLVLTVGMSVDANVLIFERIREEKAKGSAPRMSIRNGFDRAFTTIIDANLTTLIAAVVLYWIGTDQVRGFAVALVIGIITSMFTATFCSRIVFELAEKMKLVSLSMSDGVGFLKKSFLGDRDINFMGKQNIAFVLSALLIVGGMAGVFLRGKDLLNIDFTGGTSVTFQLTQPVQPDDLRTITQKILGKDENNETVQFKLVRVEKDPEDTVYTLVTSIQDEDVLSQMLVDGFANEPSTGLKTYQVDVIGPNDTDTSLNWNSGVKFVSYQEETTTETPAESSETPEPPATQEGDTPAAEPETPAADQEPAAEPASDQETPAAEVGSNEETTAEGETATEGETPAGDAGEAAATTGDEAAAGDSEATGADDSEEDLAVAVPTNVKTEVILKFSGNTDDTATAESDAGAGITGKSLQDKLITAAETGGVAINVNAVEVTPYPLPEEGWRVEDVAGFSDWKVVLPTDQEGADKIVAELQSSLTEEPLWLALSKIGGKVAGEMRNRAIAAILVSLVFIVAYIWFRFQKVAYGLAAVVALVHDVLITLGVLALCHWLYQPLGVLLIEDFKIGLTEIAAFLTIIGYSLNDTIVVFDRIREVRGRSPKLSREMINDSVNQTLSRTLLTSGTTLLTVLLLYIFGGEGIHAFAFALLIGVLVGTYSSVFIAAPVLLWISNREKSPSKIRAANNS